MSSRVNVCAVNLLDNPAAFLDPFRIEIVFEAFEYLPHDLEWEIVYVGDSESSHKDQVLESVVVGPINEGRHKFILEADPPKPELIPAENLVDVTVLLLRCSYNDQKFCDIGWFVSNEYTDEELLENPPQKPIIEKIKRTIKTDDVRVTMFTIKWDDKEVEATSNEESVSQETEGIANKMANMETDLNKVDDMETESNKMADSMDDFTSCQPLNDKTNC